jgi:hypothetical protein
LPASDTSRLHLEARLGEELPLLYDKNFDYTADRFEVN